MSCFFGKKPCITHLRTLSCLCFASILPRTDKFAPRAIRSVFMGYSNVTKGYVCYDLQQQKFFINRDVVFHEEQYPFQHFPKVSEPSSHIFYAYPAPSILDDDSEQSPDLPSTLPQDFPHCLVPISPTPVSVPSVSSHSQPLRRSFRLSKQPLWLSEYVSNPFAGNVLYPLAASISYDHLLPTYQKYLQVFFAVTEPTSYKEAIMDNRWLEAMQAELQALQDNHTWDLVHLPKEKVPIGCKWVYEVKLTANGDVERFKARLVTKGYTQNEGLDFHETFSPMVNIATFQTILSLAAQSHWSVYQLDVYNAFLQGDFHDEVYMHLPKGFASQGESGLVCRLVKSLYGLKQANMKWNLKLSEALLESGFIQSSLDHSLFIKRKGSDMILVYVDDILVTGSSLALIEHTKVALHKAFQIKDLGELIFFLGMKFSKSAKGILMNQRKYALEIISDLGLGGAKPAWTTLEANMKLTT